MLADHEFAGLHLSSTATTAASTPSSYALARSLMSITSGGTAVVGSTVGAFLLRFHDPGRVFLISAAPVGAGLPATAVSVPEQLRAPDPPPGLARPRATNAALVRQADRRVPLVNLRVPNGLVVGGEAPFPSYDTTRAGRLLAAPFLVVAPHPPLVLGGRGVLRQRRLRRDLSRCRRNCWP